MTILITGVNGFLGESFAKKYLDLNYTVYGIGIDEKRIKHKNFNYIKLNLLINEELENIPEVHFDVVFNFAWMNINRHNKNNFNSQLGNITITYNLLNHFKYKDKTTKFIFMGSTMEYSSFEFINEQTLKKPMNEYGLAKTLSRNIVDFYHDNYKMQIIYVVTTGIFSENRSDDNLIHYATTKLRKKEIPQFEALNKMWSFIHINDFIEILTKIAFKRNSYYEYYISSNECNLLSQYMKKIFKKFGNEDTPVSINNHLFPGSCCDLKNFIDDYGNHEFLMFDDYI